MKRAVLYARVSTTDQTCDTQLLDLRQMAEQRGLTIIEEFIDHGVSGARAKRPGLDRLLANARRGKFDVLLIWSFDRMARSVRHLIEVLDELGKLNIEFISFREAIDTSAALGRAMIVIVGAIAELERNLIVERVRAGMRRARLEGRHIGRRPRGQSLGQLARTYRAYRTTIRRVLNGVPKGPSQSSPQPQQNRRPETAA